MTSWARVLSGLMVLGSLDGFAAPTEDQIAFFETRIRPAIHEHCMECHDSEGKAKGGLVLNRRAGFMKGGDLGAVLNLENPADSRILTAIQWKNSALQMPPKTALPLSIQADFEKWVMMGAPWPDDAEGGIASREAQEIDFEQERSGHWAFRPVQKPTLPDEASGREIDWLIGRSLAEAGLSPSEEAQRHTLIRRAYLTLIGLPPTAAQAEEFIRGDTSWDEVVEELLNSSQYGAKWARHWLDVARFADGYGGFLDKAKFEMAWRYRDWVIDAFNEDMRYDQFVRLQLAGDLVAPEEHAVATGFLALGPHYQGDGGDKLSNAIAAAETLDDRVDTVGRGLLGLTLACARCHDHKFDPIPIMDYYSFAGVFENTGVVERPLVSSDEVAAYKNQLKTISDYKREVDQWLQDKADEVAQQEAGRLVDYVMGAQAYEELAGSKPGIVQWAKDNGFYASIMRHVHPFFSKPENTMKEIFEVDAWFEQGSAESLEALQEVVTTFPQERRVHEFMKRIFRSDRNQVRAEIKDDEPLFEAGIVQYLEHHKELERTKPAKYAYAHVVQDRGRSNMKVAIRGNRLTPGEEAPRRNLRILEERQPLLTEGSGRQQLAEALVSRDNPLLARVFVNRVWGWHFGHGLVRTPSNFGKLGESPSHPELLDWLTATFVEDGWSVKALHRRLLHSATWKQSSQFRADCFAVDGDNRLLWRMNPRRLSVEVWRDSVLRVSGNLNPVLGGQPFDTPDGDYRRTIHARASRNGDKFATDPFLRLFDFPVPRASVAKRTPTITPQQSLFLLNNPFITRQSEDMVKRLPGLETKLLIEHIYQRLYARAPDAEELRVAHEFLGANEEVARQRLPRYAKALLASNEFMFIE